MYRMFKNTYIIIQKLDKSAQDCVIHRFRAANADKAKIEMGTWLIDHDMTGSFELALGVSSCASIRIISVRHEDPDAGPSIVGIPEE